MSEKLLIAVNCEDSAAEDIVKTLRNAGADIGDYEVSRSKDSVKGVIESVGCDYTVMIIQYALKESTPLTVNDFDELHTINEKIQIIPILPDTLVGTDYVKSLFDVGIYNGVFDKDSNAQSFVKIINSGGRSRKESKEYYGLKSAAGVKESVLEPAVDPVAMLRYICNPQNGTLKERADYVRGKVSSEMFATLINNLPDEITEELKMIDGYGIFFGTELPDGTKIEPKIVEVEKEVVKEVVKKEISFVDVNEIIGVVGLTPGAGSTMIALNLAAQLVGIDGLTPTFVQFPATNSQAFNSLGLMDAMGYRYVSHIAQVGDGHPCGKELNLYKGINICVPNPYTDHRIENKWEPEMMYRLLLGLPNPVVLDLGSYYTESSYRSLIMSMKHLIVVVDDDVENDIRQIDKIKDIKTENPSIDISFVFNKCMNEPTDLIQIVGEGFGKLVIPKIENKYFMRAKDGLVIKCYGNSLLGLAKLAGYGYSDITSNDVVTNENKSGKIPENFIAKISPGAKVTEGIIRREKKTKVKANRKKEHKRVNIGVSVEIGVGGVSRGVGTTHTALMIADMLGNKYRVAVVEQNSTGAFAALYRKLNPYMEYLTVVPMFTYKGIAFFPNCNYSYFASQFRDDYDFIIVDFGDELCCTDFLRMSRRIVVASGADWKINELKNFVDEVAEREDKIEAFNYFIPFLPANGLGEIQKRIMKHSAAGIYSVPYCPEWDNSPVEMVAVINDIMGNVHPERKRSRFKLF